MLFEHFFCAWRCQKEVAANPQDHSGRESMPDDVCKTGSKILARTLATSKRIKRLAKFSEIDVTNLVLNKDSTNT